jgi:hypothetical protein
MVISVAGGIIMTGAVLLDLRHHCIATEIRRRYSKCLSGCLRGGAVSDETERELELLKKALETMDFPVLRSTYTELSGGTDANVCLGPGEGGAIRLTIDGRTVRIFTV